MLVSGAGGNGIGVYFLAEAVIGSSPHPAHRLRALNLPSVPGYRRFFDGEQSRGNVYLYVEHKYLYFGSEGIWYYLGGCGLYYFGIIWLTVDSTYFDIIWLTVVCTYFGIIWLTVNCTYFGIIWLVLERTYFGTVWLIVDLRIMA